MVSRPVYQKRPAFNSLHSSSSVHSSGGWREGHNSSSVHSSWGVGGVVFTIPHLCTAVCVCGEGGGVIISHLCTAVWKGGG